AERSHLRCAARTPAGAHGCRRPDPRSSFRSESWRVRPRRPEQRRKRPRRSRKARDRNRENRQRRRYANWLRVRPDMRWNAWPSCVFPRREHFSRAFQIVRAVNAERRGVDERDVNSHARLERPQLFEFFTALQRRRGQANKSPKRVTAISVKADMVQEAPLAPRSARAGEVERP